MLMCYIVLLCCFGSMIDNAEMRESHIMRTFPPYSDENGGSTFEADAPKKAVRSVAIAATTAAAAAPPTKNDQDCAAWIIESTL